MAKNAYVICWASGNNKVCGKYLKYHRKRLEVNSYLCVIGYGFHFNYQNIPQLLLYDEKKCKYKKKEVVNCQWDFFNNQFLLECLYISLWASFSTSIYTADVARMACKSLTSSFHRADSGWKLRDLHLDLEKSQPPQHSLYYRGMHFSALLSLIIGEKYFWHLIHFSCGWLRIASCVTLGSIYLNQ